MTDARYAVASPGRGLGLEVRALAPHGDTVIAIAAHDGARSRESLEELTRQANATPGLIAALRALLTECRAHLDYEDDEDMEAACDVADAAIRAADPNPTA